MSHKKSPDDPSKIKALQKTIRSLKKQKLDTIEAYRKQEMLRQYHEERIRAINDSYNRLTTYAGITIFHVLPENGQVVYVNPAAEKLFGYSLEEWLARPQLLWNSIHPNSEDIKKEILRRTRAEEDLIRDLTPTWISKSGQEIITDLTVVAVRDETGRIMYYESIARDISDQSRAVQELRLSEARYRAVVEDQSELICRFLKDGTITFVNEAYCRFFKKSREELIGYTFWPVVPENEQRLAYFNHLTLNQENPHNNIEHRIIMNDGEIRWLQWSDRGIFDKNGNIVEYQSVGRDVTDSKDLETKLTYLGMHDALTGLYNRAYFDEEMRRLSNSRSLPIGIIVTDINGLKMVNDLMGHQSGDELIKAAAEVLKQCFRQSDVVARIGGDEFVVLLPETDEEILLCSCARIKTSILDFNEANLTLPLSMAVGFSIKTDPGQKLENVFADADNEMYKEKEAQRQNERFKILEKLRKADVETGS